MIPTQRKLFFDHIRKRFGSLSQDAVEGTEAVIAAWEKYAPCVTRTIGGLAYVLGTARWETARTMQPIAEYGKGRGRVYGQLHAPVMSGSSKRVKNNQIYYGRGYVQLTWFENYLKQSNKLGVDLITNADKAMEPEIAAAVLVGGMYDGDFTGRKMSQYFTPTTNNFVGARAIVNGRDKANEIAALARVYFDALKLAGFR